jgi:hypothetical protein
MSKLETNHVRDRFPSVDMDVDDWVDFFSTSAGFDAMGKITYDIYREVLSREERRAGIKRQGRRPRRPVAPLSEVLRRVYPEQWSMDPVTDSLPRLIDASDYTFNEFAEAAFISRPYLVNIIAGRRKVNLKILETFARLGKVQPWYFVEWRALFFGELIQDVLLAAPNLGVAVVKGMRGHGRLRREHPLGE